MCEHKFTNTRVLKTQMKAIHKIQLSKHTLEIEAILSNEKVKKNHKIWKSKRIRIEESSRN